MNTFDARAVGAGLVAALVVLVPMVVVVRVLLGDDRLSGGAVIAVVLITIVAIAFGGFVTGRRQRDLPAQHGAATGALAYVLTQLLASASRGEFPNVISMLLAALVFACVGMIGAWLAATDQRQPREDHGV